ncbi:MAG: hypothetical protein INQ03_13565 [Candidatus Heimdallarchaeota archaeon]|nr:hypothetical protein [Candidatus Heimdallarchaeota archaeon]
MVKILVPIRENKGRDSVPGETLGRQAEYYILDTDNEANDIVLNNTSNAFGGNIPPIKFVISQEADYIFTREACANALKFMKSANMIPYLVGEEKISTLLNKYHNNELQILTEPNECSH